MPHHVVLEADWFVIEGAKYFKKLAYFAPTLGLFGEFTFSLPQGAAAHRSDLIQQARGSHGLDWREDGQYRHDQVNKAIIAMLNRLGTTNLVFCTKGLDRVNLFQQFLRSVIDLNAMECPPFESLCLFRESAMLKAIYFGKWLQWSA